MTSAGAPAGGFAVEQATTRREAPAARPIEAPPATPPPRFAHVAALDGLRGVAVVLVVVYHFAPQVLPAGFIGVDVFFVLSGFLITSLALGEHDSSGAISARSFYVRRARRLLPAAVTTIVVTIALAAVLEPDSTRAARRGEGIASLLYAANWWSIGQNDSYQAAFGGESPLSHFWSLAVEEQFYLLFPLALIGALLLVRRRRGTTRALALAVLCVALAGAVASAAAMAWMHSPTADPSRVYFGTDTRIQAPLLGVAGACAWWLWSDWIRSVVRARALAVAAVACVVVLGFVSATTGFRDEWLYRFGFLAIAAAALVVLLSACASRSPLTRALEWRWLGVLGLASYSIYLWHWPIRVFVTGDRTGYSGGALFAVRVGLTAVAAWLSYRFVERPFRRSRQPSRVALLWVGGIAVGACAVWVLARPVPAPASEFSTATAPTVVASPDPPLRVLWFGDSVAWSLGGGHVDFPRPVNYDSPFDPARVTLWNKADYGCPLVPNPQRSFGIVKQNTGWCVDREANWPPLIAEFSPDVVVWSATMFDTYEYLIDDRWTPFGSPEWEALYRANLDEARRVATASGATFVLLAQADPIPNPDEENQETLLPENVWRYGHVRDLQRQFAAEHPDDTRFVDLQPIVCPDDSCASMTIDAPGGRPDGVHFSAEYAVEVAPPIADALRAAAGWRG